MDGVVFVQVLPPLTKFSLRNKSLRNSGEYAKGVFACFYLRRNTTCLLVKLCRVLQEYGIGGRLLLANKSLFYQPEVHVNGKISKSFHMGCGLRQRRVLSPLLFIILMNWMDKLSQTDECVSIGRIANDLVLLDFSESMTSQ